MPMDTYALLLLLLLLLSILSNDRVTQKDNL